tara:strand:+ start:2995 stop:3249 length:255 start_codon:yes stop_codon:yes gene_type:complete
MMSNAKWIDAKNNKPVFNEETRVIVLLKQDNTGFCGMPLKLDERTHKAWWIPQRECFSVGDVEDANFKVTHWFEIPSDPMLDKG